MARVSAAEAVIRILEAEGIPYVFGNPGTTEAPLLDALVAHPDIQFILGLQENIVVGMAGGYALATGKPGVAMLHTTYGTASGYLNLVNAHSEQIPVVGIAGQQHTAMLLTEPSLNFYLHGPVKEMTKWMWEVRSVSEVPHALRRAIKVALDPPRGPTFLVLPSNLAREELEISDIPPPEKSHPNLRIRGDPEAIIASALLLLRAERPCLIYGAAAVRSGAIPELTELAELLSIRVYAAPRFPHLAFPTDHPLYLGVFDRAAGENTDLVLGVGLKMFREHEYNRKPLIPSGTRIIHVDPDAHEIAKNYPVEVGVLADPKMGIRDLIETIKSLLDTDARTRIQRRAREVAALKQLLTDALDREVKKEWGSVPIKTTRLVKEIRKALDRRGVIVEEAVRSTRALERHFDIYEPDTFVRSTGGLGWSLAAAIGVKLGRPDREVVAYIGDGSFMYTTQALWTMARHRVPVVTIICNNRSYISQKAILYQMGGLAAETGRYIGTDLVDPEVDFVGLAESLGVHGVRVERPDDIGASVREALSSGAPYLIDVLIDEKEAGSGLRLP